MEKAEKATTKYGRHTSFSFGRVKPFESVKFLELCHNTSNISQTIPLS